MATTSTTGRVFPLPDLVGVKAAQAIEQLRELGLTPVPLPSVVADVAEAGFVLGLDPPPSAIVRPKTRITISVATHPDFDGRADAALAQGPAVPVQPPLGWPRSAPAGLAEPEPEFDPRDLGAPNQTAAVPPAQSAPAPEIPGVAFPEPPFAGSSSAATPGDSAAPPFDDDLSASVPTPDEYADMDAWDRIRAEEASQFTAPQGAGREDRPSPDFDDGEPVVQAELVDVARERAEEDEKRREARRQSARRYRRLTLKQKAVVGTVLLSTLLLVLAAASGHKHPAKATSTRRPSHGHASKRSSAKHAGAPKTHTTPKRVATPKHHKHPVVKVRRVVQIRTRTRTRVVTVTVPTTTPTASSTPTSGSTSATHSYTPPVQPPVTHTVTASTPTHTSSPSSSKPASTHTSTNPTQSGTGSGGSTLQSPNGAIAPPKPTQP